MHRIQFRTKSFELEVESTDPAFIQEQRNLLKSLTTQGLPGREEADRVVEAGPAPDGASPGKASKPAGTRSRRRRIKATMGSGQSRRPAATEEEYFDKLIQVVKQVKDSRYYDRVDSGILQKSNQLNRILLGMYFSEGIFSEAGLTTGELELVTKALGVPIRQPNIATQLKKYSGLFTADGSGVPRRGVVMHYRLSDQGRKKFEKFLRNG